MEDIIILWEDHYYPINRAEIFRFLLWFSRPGQSWLFFLSLHSFIIQWKWLMLNKITLTYLAGLNTEFTWMSPDVSENSVKWCYDYIVLWSVCVWLSLCVNKRTTAHALLSAGGWRTRGCPDAAPGEIQAPRQASGGEDRGQGIHVALGIWFHEGMCSEGLEWKALQECQQVPPTLSLELHTVLLYSFIYRRLNTWFNMYILSTDCCPSDMRYWKLLCGSQ